VVVVAVVVVVFTQSSPFRQACRHS